MKNKMKFFGTQSQRLCLIALVAVIGFAFIACSSGGGGGGGSSSSSTKIPVNFESPIPDGSSTQTTTKLTLNFSEEIKGLTAANISLSGVKGVTKGTLTGSGTTYTLNIKVTASGTLTVTVTKSGYTIPTQTVQIYYYNDGSGTPPGGNQTPTNGLTYTLLSSGTAYEVSRGTVTGGPVVIASVYNGLPVTEIATIAFMELDITSVTIPNSVTTIKMGAFSDCTSLTSVTIGSGVTTIGAAFAGCTGLTSITVASENTTYRSEGNCMIRRADNTLVLGCKTSVIPSSVTTIASAFASCTSLTSINIPNNVTTIGASAFSGCTGLTSITIPYNVTSIGRTAFAGCTGLTNITIGSGVTTIEYGAFTRCTGLTSVTFATGSNILDDDFASQDTGPGYWLRGAYLAANPKAGTYTRTPPDERNWTKQ